MVETQEKNWIWFEGRGAFRARMVSTQKVQGCAATSA